MTNKKLGVKLTIGISNCGKSTWAREFIRNNPMWTEINRDDMRIAFFCDGKRSEYVNYKFSKDREKMITDIAETRAKRAMRNGQGIIISDTNLNGKTRAYWKNFAETHNVPYEEVVFDVPLHVCMSRNRKRDITLPDHVLRQQYSNFRQFTGMPTYTGTPGSVKAVIFDVDGTLASMDGRSPFDWSKVGEDKPKPHVVELAKLLHAAGYAIIVMSGRDGSCRDATREWLEENGIPFEALFMRTAGDQRADAIIKEELFWSEVSENWDVKYVVDDRNKTVEQWRAIGIECWQVAHGDF